MIYTVHAFNTMTRKTLCSMLINIYGCFLQVRNDILDHEFNSQIFLHELLSMHQLCQG